MIQSWTVGPLYAQGRKVNVAARWNIVGLILVAGVITAAAIPASRVLSDYILRIRQKRERILAALFGAACGLAFWPVLAVLILRYFPPYLEWLRNAPPPVNSLAGPGALLGLIVVTVGGPAGLLVLLHRRYRTKDDD